MAASALANIAQFYNKKNRYQPEPAMDGGISSQLPLPVRNLATDVRPMVAPDANDPGEIAAPPTGIVLPNNSQLRQSALTGLAPAMPPNAPGEIVNIPANGAASGTSSNELSPLSTVTPSTAQINPTALEVAPVPDDVDSARRKYENAVAQPIQKKSAWKDVLAYAAQFANNVFNPNNQVEYGGWGKVQHDKAVGKALDVYQPLQKMADVEYNNANRDANLKVLQSKPVTDALKLQLDAQDKTRDGLLKQLGLMKSYKRGAHPEFDEQLKQAGINQPEFSPDKKIQPRYRDASGRLMTFDSNGDAIPVKRADGTFDEDPRAATVDYNGYKVTPGQALNANTQTSVINYNTGKANIAEDNDYQGKYNQFTNQKNAVEAQAIAAEQEASVFDTQLGELQNRKAQIAAELESNRRVRGTSDTIVDEDERKRIIDQADDAAKRSEADLRSIQNEIDSVTRQAAGKRSEATRYKQQANGMTAPARGKSYGQYGGVKNKPAPPSDASEESILAAARRNGLNQQQTDALLADFRSKKK